MGQLESWADKLSDGELNEQATKLVEKLEDKGWKTSTVIVLELMDRLDRKAEEDDPLG